VRAAFDAGITAFDTATVYGNGHSERIVGQALADCRPQVVIATKVFSNRLRRDQVVAACEQSLRDLGTDYIDLYQIHWPPGSFGGEAMKRLQEQGKIRAITRPKPWIFAVKTASRCWPIRPWPRGCSPASSARIIGLPPGTIEPRTAYSSRRSMTGYRRPWHSCGRWPSAWVSPWDSWPALAWVIAHENTCAIAGARNPEQVRQNAAAGDLVLDEVVLAELDRLGRTVTDHLDDNPMLWDS